MDYLSVTEYAKKYNIDRATVNRYINSSRIPAYKVGYQWCIPSDAPPPEDRRVKSGKYKNWRKKPEA